MTEFKKGDRVFVKPGMSSRYGWAPEDDATPLTVVRVEHDYRVFVRLPWDGAEYSFRPEDLTHAAPETPAPLDPSRVKPGDTVTLEMEGGRKVTAPVSESTVPGKTKGTWFLDVYPDDDPVSFSKHHWTLTDHQPAPEPEPEWLFEFMGEGGPEGDEHWVRRFATRAEALRSMIESASLDELNDFEGPVSFSVYSEETGPAESRLVVIDPADVDVEALQAAIDGANGGAEARAVLQFFGIEVQR